ncbi:hypothetical protein PSTT_00855, partial [Puccinia striiformis]
ILLVQHSISILPSTLTCKRQVWGLRQNEIPKPVVSELLPPIRDSLLLSYSKCITVTIHTVKRYLSRLDLRLNGDDLANGKVTLGKVYGAIDHIQKFLLDNNTGYRRVKTLLMRNYNIRIPSYHQYGTETCDVSTYQMMLSHCFGGITLEEASQCMHHTKSTHNQKIKCLWSQMMRQHNSKPIVLMQDVCLTSVPVLVDSGFPVKCQYLGQPKQPRSQMEGQDYQPTHQLYTRFLLEAFHTVDQLILVDTEYIQRLLQDNYQNIDDMFTHTHLVFTRLLRASCTILGWVLI